MLRRHVTQGKRRDMYGWGGAAVRLLLWNVIGLADQDRFDAQQQLCVRAPSSSSFIRERALVVSSAGALSNAYANYHDDGGNVDDHLECSSVYVNNHPHRSVPHQHLIMQVDVDLAPILGGHLVRLDAMRIKQLQNIAVYKAIDQLGLLSAQTLHLRTPLTSCDKLVHQSADDRQSLYLLWQPNDDTNRQSSLIIGLLKVGRKSLFLYNTDMAKYEGSVLCILDFYVHFSRQRAGYGRQLFDFMLQNERVNSEQLALDNPSVTLLAFMSKHYRLDAPIWQNTNMVVYPEYFRSINNDVALSPTNGADSWRRLHSTTDSRRYLSDAISGHCSRANATSNCVVGDQTTEGTQANRVHRARQRVAHNLSSTPLW